MSQRLVPIGPRRMVLKSTGMREPKAENTLRKIV